MHRMLGVSMHVATAGLALTGLLAALGSADGLLTELDDDDIM